jgi:hypothetical protein
MKKPLIAAICATLVLGACGSIGSSRLNPFNWFGSSQEVVLPSLILEAPADPRSLVASVTELTLERLQGGVIVRATGLPQTQGFWDAELVALPAEGGRLVYDFRVFPPTEVSDASTPQSREITVAAFLTNFQLEGISDITVQGAANARSSRRR